LYLLLFWPKTVASWFSTQNAFNHRINHTSIFIPAMHTLRSRQPLGPQIHAVPDNEKAYDVSGRKLPWGYEQLPTNLDSSDRREPIEKGAFGKRTNSRRGTSRSRSKTAEPQREEDRIRREQAVAEERVFGSLRKVVRETGGSGEGKEDGAAPTTAAKTTAVKIEGEGEATEVLLYGFGEDLQWAGIDFYERVSGGVVLEDYDRTAPGQLKAYDPTHAVARSTMTRSLSKAALKKKNRYQGGEHWIKITFSSRESAELACARSPHVIKGHLVYAEPWQGRGPARDEAIPATQAGAQVVGDQLPPTFATTTGGFGGSPNGSNTISSATEREGNGEAGQTLAQPQSLQSFQQAAPVRSSSLDLTTSTQQLQQRRQTGTLTRLQGARPAVLLPAEQALMPKQPKQSWTAWLGASELIGTTVPRKENGSFDKEKASLYWRVWWWVDGWLGTDFCGLRADE
jgi:hypothetical protein